MSGVTPERMRELLAGITPGEWEQYVQTDGSIIVVASRVPASGEDGGEGQPVLLLASEMGSRHADLLCAATALARAYLAQVEEVGRLRSALEGALAVLDEVARLDEAQAKLSAEYLDLARRARAGEMVRRPTPQVVDYGDVWEAISGLRPVVRAALAPQGGE